MEKKRAVELLTQEVDKIPYLKTLPSSNDEFRLWLKNVENIINKGLEPEDKNKYQEASQFLRYLRGVHEEDLIQQDYIDEIVRYEIALKSIIQKYEILGIKGKGGQRGSGRMNEAQKQKTIIELKDFHKKLKSYGRLLDPDRQLSEAQKRYRDSLREILQRKIGNHKDIITQLTGKQFYKQFGTTGEIWAEGLRTSGYLSSMRFALTMCIDVTNEAIGKLESDIERGIRDVEGNLIEETRNIDTRESPKTYENIGGKIFRNEFEVALQGTVDMTIECMMHFTKKLNSQGHSYKSNPRIGGQPDYANPDRTCSATVTIAEITESKEKQIGTIELQLIPDEKTLFKTSHPKEWNSSFKYFLDALFAEFEQLGFIKKEKTTIVEDLPPETLVAKANWKDIKTEYGVTKRSFGKRINFVKDPFKRTVIYRDVEQAFILEKSGFSKPAVILAGGVIEELLRLYLKQKGISPQKPLKKDFNGYIQTCEQKGLLKAGISRLSDSARYFRNLVHLSNEETNRHAISKSIAKGAVASIFTISNDF